MRDDLRTTLTLIATQLDALIKSVKDEPFKTQLESIHKNASRVLDMVNDPNHIIATEPARDAGNLSLDEELIERALKHVEDNLQNPSYSVEQLSKDLNMDRTGLYRKLLALTGYAPTMFIRSIRLKKAVLLLNQKRYSQAEIADKVGFSNGAYFSKCFKEEYGVSPSNYNEE